MMKPDYQRESVYTAERAAFQYHLNEVISWREAAKLSKEWAKVHDISIRSIGMLPKDSRYAALATTKRKEGEYTYSLEYQYEGLYVWIVAHELAHFLSFDSHGPNFCRDYIRLVKLHISEMSSYVLEASFRDYGVDIAY